MPVPRQLVCRAAPALPRCINHAAGAGVTRTARRDPEPVRRTACRHEGDNPGSAGVACRVAASNRWGYDAPMSMSTPPAPPARDADPERGPRAQAAPGAGLSPPLAVAPTPVVSAIILAAGQGTRMKSALPKVLHPLAGRPLLHYPVRAALEAGRDDVVVVVGHGATRSSRVPANSTFAERVRTAVQETQRGHGRRRAARAGARPERRAWPRAVRRHAAARGAGPCWAAARCARRATMRALAPC